MFCTSAGDHGRTSMRSRMHIVMSLRSAPKPECISQVIERAQARGSGASGHMPAWRSARYSAIASVSHTRVSPSWRHGTSPDGENAKYGGLGVTPPSGEKISSNGAPESFVTSQPRSDHDE